MLKSRLYLLNLMIASLFVAFLSGSCNKNDARPSTIIRMGHGGEGFQSLLNVSPSNTWPSIEKALDVLGADGVEIDAALSADGKWVLYHDEFLDSQTGCSGCIQNQTWEQLQRCSYMRSVAGALVGHKHKLILLEDVLLRYNTLPQKPLLMIDLRLGNPCGETSITRALKDELVNISDLIIKFQAHTWVKPLVRDIKAANQLHAVDNRLQIYWDVAPAEVFKMSQSLSSIKGVVVPFKKVDSESIAMLKKSGLEVFLFGPKTQPDILACVQLAPTGIQADNLEILMQVTE